MGRYYTGDIEGKFWFGVQPSNDGEFFGCEQLETNTIPYRTEDLKAAETGLQKCVDELGEYRTQLDQFFHENLGYNDRMLARTLNVSPDQLCTLLEWYARYQLGRQIVNCLKEHGFCEFEAEI